MTCVLKLQFITLPGTKTSDIKADVLSGSLRQLLMVFKFKLIMWFQNYLASSGMQIRKQSKSWTAMDVTMFYELWIFEVCLTSWKMTLVIKNPPANAGIIRDAGSIPRFGMMPWRKAWQPTPVFLPGESHGQRSLAGYSPWSHKELDTTEST